MTNNFLIHNFKHLTTTPENVQQLKKMVLQMAVQGKLTEKWREDNPDVEPASVLLEKIRKEKEQLINDKRLKRGVKRKKIKTLRNFDLQLNWEWCKGDDIFFTTKLAGFEYTKYIKLQEIGDIPVIRAQNVRKVTLNKDNLLFIDEVISYSLERSALVKKCLLVTFIGAGIGDVAYFNEKNRWHLAPNVAKMELFENCDNLLNLKYLNYYLISEKGQQQLFKHIKATAQPSLSMETIRDIDFVIPPLAEQQAIVSKIEKLFTQIDQLHALAQKRLNYREKSAKALFSKINQAENDTELQEVWQTLTAHFQTLTQSKESVKQLRQSILQMAVQGKLTARWREHVKTQNFASPDNPNYNARALLARIKAKKEQLSKEGKIKKQKTLQSVSDDEKAFALPESWEWIRLIDYGLTNTGTTPSKNNPEYFGRDYPFVKPAEISLKGINYDTVDGLTEVGLNQGRIIHKNSVLMVCIGGSIGKSFYTNRDVSCNQQINTITPLAWISSEFLHYFLQSIYFQSEVWSRASGGTTPIINKGKWERIPISLPPLSEQKAIVSKVKQLMAWCDELEKKIEKRDAYQEKMMQAVVKQAFKTEKDTVEME